MTAHSSVGLACRVGGTRFPFEPLEEALGGRCGLANARRLGVHVRQLYRWRQTGVTWAQADELAIAAGLHPAEVWPDW